MAEPHDAPSLERDAYYMSKAIALGAKNPSLPFGAILVDREADEVVAEGLNRASESPIWHGEIDAIHRYAAAHKEPRWSRLVLYTTAEPCPMCQAAILWAGIPRVIYGTSIATLQARGWSQIDITAHEIARRTPFADCEIRGGVLRAECDRLFQAERGGRKNSSGVRSR